MKNSVAIIAPCTRPVPPIKGGGVQIGIYEVTKHFKKYKPYVFSIDDENLPEHQTIGNTEYFHINVNKTSIFKRFIYSFSLKEYIYYCSQIANKINRLKPDIIHIRVNPWFVTQIKKRLKYNPKIILQHHTCPLNKSFKTWELKRLLKKIDLFTGVSKFVVDTEVIKRLPNYKDMTKVIYNGINHDQFSPLWQNDDKRMKLRREAGILDDEILLLYVGQIRADKGVLSVVKAFETLLGSHSNIKLMIIGSASGGNDNPNNRQQKFFDEFNLHIKQLPSKKVIQQGFISRKEIQNIFLMGDIFCAPSIVTETFGLVIAEAMATGLPIITSNKGGIPEVIGDTGFVTTRPEEPDDIIMYANQLIADKKLRLDCGKKAFNRIIENFTWEITAQRTEEIYDQLLK